MCENKKGNIGPSCILPAIVNYLNFPNLEYYIIN